MKLNDCKLWMRVRTNKAFSDFFHDEPIRNAKIVGIYRYNVEIEYGAMKRLMHPDWLEPAKKKRLNKKY